MTFFLVMAEVVLAALVAVECLCVLAIAGIFHAHAGRELKLASAVSRGDEPPRESESF